MDSLDDCTSINIVKGLKLFGGKTLASGRGCKMENGSSWDLARCASAGRGIILRS